MKKSIPWPIIINAALFQLTWFACVMGGAKGLLWPALVACTALAIWQLQPRRRHSSDIKLILISIVLGLVIDTAWVQVGFMKFTGPEPFSSLAPAWIIVLWIGFALTLNHSLVWLKAHPLLPAIAGLICAPMSYLAGLKFGAVEYLTDTVLISICLGIAWAIALTILVKASQQPQTAQTTA